MYFRKADSFLNTSAYQTQILKTQWWLEQLPWHLVGEAEGLYLSNAPGLFPAPAPEQERGQGPTARFPWAGHSPRLVLITSLLLVNIFIARFSLFQLLLGTLSLLLGCSCLRTPSIPALYHWPGGSSGPCKLTALSRWPGGSSGPCKLTALWLQRPLVLHTLFVFIQHVARCCSCATA